MRCINDLICFRALPRYTPHCLITTFICKLPRSSVQTVRLFHDYAKYPPFKKNRHKKTRFPCENIGLNERPLASFRKADSAPDRKPGCKSDREQYDYTCYSC